MNNLNFGLIIHPGETLNEVLNNIKMTQEKLSAKTSFSLKYINNVISGKDNITFEFANKLENVLDINTNFWINLQANYDKEIISLNNLKNKLKVN